MRSFQSTNPIWHALLWVVVYIVAVNVGDALSAAVGIPNAVTAALLVVLSVGLVWYCRRNGWTAYYGLTSVRAEVLPRMWYYAPFVVIVAAMLLRGLKPDLTLLEVVLICILMVCVGFLEELLFRGFLFKGILVQSNLNRAVLISGVTFGIGHIVNLARGMSPAEQTIQIIAGIFLGIALAYCMAITGTIIPGVIFHTLLNISGNITSSSLEVETLVLGVMVVASVVYSLYLRQLIARRKPLRA